MSERERYAKYLGVPEILVQCAVLDGCLESLIEYQLKTFREHTEDEFRADLRDALQVAC